MEPGEPSRAEKKSAMLLWEANQTVKPSSIQRLWRVMARAKVTGNTSQIKLLLIQAALRAGFARGNRLGRSFSAICTEFISV